VGGQIYSRGAELASVSSINDGRCRRSPGHSGSRVEAVRHTVSRAVMRGVDRLIS
jgi:hypothetical protein